MASHRQRVLGIIADDGVTRGRLVLGEPAQRFAHGAQLACVVGAHLRTEVKGRARVEVDRSEELSKRSTARRRQAEAALDHDGTPARRTL